MLKLKGKRSIVLVLVVGWFWTPTLAVFLIYRGVNKLYNIFSTSTRLLEIKHFAYKTIVLYVHIKEKLKE
jgi:hypothetical protein